MGCRNGCRESPFAPCIDRSQMLKVRLNDGRSLEGATWSRLHSLRVIGKAYTSETVPVLSSTASVSSTQSHVSSVMMPRCSAQ